MSNLDTKINQISLQFKELKKAEFYPVKKNLIGAIRKTSNQALMLLDKMDISTNNIRKRKQIQDILKKCTQIEIKIDEEEKVHPEIGNGGRFSNLSINNKNGGGQFKQQPKQSTKDLPLQQKSIMVARSIIEYQITSKQLKISPQEIDLIAQRMQVNTELMKEIELMIHEQGEDVEKVQKNISDTYEIAKEANIDLQEAAKLQHQGRLLKIRLGVTGVLGAIGMKILGLPGLVLGLFVGGTASLKK